MRLPTEPVGMHVDMDVVTVHTEYPLGCLCTQELTNLRDDGEHAFHRLPCLVPLPELCHMLTDIEEPVEFLEYAKCLVTTLSLLLASLTARYQSADGRHAD